MRMSDNTNSEVMKVSAEVPPTTDPASSLRDGATTSEVSEQIQIQTQSGSTKKETQPVKYSKSSTRLRLVRSLAVCEESFPCSLPEPSAAAAAAPQDAFHLQPIEKEDQAAQDREEEASDKPEKTLKKRLSRDSSQDYTDSTGIDLHQFLVNTLKNNPRDRIMLLKLEQDLLEFISSNGTQKRKFPPMTAYHRMLLHRVAAYFGMEHNVDSSGKSVVINKTINTRIPDQKFSEHIKDDRTDDFQKLYILKRDNSSFDRDDGTNRMRLKADKRSKSMEEREEEYQRARERIFAHDADHFVLDRSPQSEETCMSSQQRRQMFRLRAGRSGASRQSSSETEMLPRHSEPRPWSSTDSSDSSNRLAPRPAITKASSFSGITPSLVRGDSSTSSKSTGRLSKTDSCSSVGSSSSSLLPLPLHPPSRSSFPTSPLVQQSSSDPRSPGHTEIIKSAPSLPPPPPTPLPSTDPTNFYVLPLEASGIPPGSVLVNPHTGKPFLHPDGSAVLFNPPSVVLHAAAGRNLLQGKNPQQPISAAAGQQQPTNHLHSQPICPPFQPSSEPVHNPTVSYPPLPPPNCLPPSQFLPICSNQQFTVPDVLNTQFSHMTLTQPPPTDSGSLAPDARHYPTVYHPHMSPMLLQGPPSQQVANYMVAAPSGGHTAVLQGQPVQISTPGPNHAFTSATPGPAGFPSPTLNQPVLQQHAFIQQPLQQMSTCYCSSAHHPHCSTQQQQQQQQLQHYRPSVTPLPYNCPQSQNLPQQQVYQGVMPNPAPSYQTVVGVQPTPNLTLSDNQQSNIGNQMPGMMVQYPHLQSYQQVPQQSYQQQPLYVSCPPGQGAVAVAVSGMQPCYNLLPQNQHATMSSTLSFLPTPMMEQLQFSQTSSPCFSQQQQLQQQQHSAQQYTGLLHPPPGGGVVMLQMTPAPPQQQPGPRALSPCQRKQPGYKHPGSEQQRDRRPTELPPDITQSSLSLSPALTPSLGQPPSAKGLPAGFSTVPVMAHPPHLHTAFCPHGQGDAHLSLLGQPLHYNPSIRPPLLHAAHMMTKHQGARGVWRGGHGRKGSRKSLSSDLS
ncbi:R3H domain-containing protein 1 isoform X3 [Cynoglossus semilaevis]|uniref:R3H domain-containing protein 1 isoform X3 n=1 Tax=Cynoglossus semilaevis TaxID=244447 RepID=UPI000D62EE3F|nr:R3H domain-containing protein 1 isoform X3 [Cynoglossus semilaevis]